MKSIPAMIDHTLLKPDATKEMVKALCEEAIQYKFAAVCVNPYYVSYCNEILGDTDVKIASVIGFPLGASTKEVKAFETADSVKNGAVEIDMVINIGALKDKAYDIVKEDIEYVVKAASPKAIVKVIIETCLLTEEEKKKACELSMEAGAHFVKTSTGFSTGGATVDDVKLMKSIVGDKLEVKASGGVRDLSTAKAMIEAGASRLGSSSGINIVKELEQGN
jgi:deoxyribose-phosphate aldolase